jgi:histone acetyltransferase
LIEFFSFQVGYFKKQGFSSTITLNEQVYTGYIKDYDGATLMQCSLYTQVTYTRLTETLSLIKETINVIRTHRYNQIKHAHPDAKFLANDIPTTDLNHYHDLINPDSNESNSSEDTGDINLLYITLKSVYQEIRSHPYASHVQKRTLFQDNLSTPVIFPIDLDTIHERLKSKYYHNAYTFTADISRLLDIAGKAYSNQKKDHSNDIRAFDTFVRRKMNEFGLEMGHA